MAEVGHQVRSTSHWPGSFHLALSPKIHFGEPASELQHSITAQTNQQHHDLNVKPHIATLSNLQIYQSSHTQHERNGLVRATTNAALPSKHPGYFCCSSGDYLNGLEQDPEDLANTISRNRLNAAEQRELQGRMERKQMKDFMNVCITIRSDPNQNQYRGAPCDHRAQLTRLFTSLDVLQPRAALLHRLRHRLHFQVAAHQGGGLRHALRRQVP